MKRPDRLPHAATVFLASTILLAVACTDIATSDHETCVSRGFERSTSEYDYCRDKLQELRDVEEERKQRFLELLTG